MEKWFVINGFTIVLEDVCVVSFALTYKLQRDEVL